MLTTKTAQLNIRWNGYICDNNQWRTISAALHTSIETLQTLQQGDVITPNFLYPGSKAGLFVGVTSSGCVWIAYDKAATDNFLSLDDDFIAKYKRMCLNFAILNTPHPEVYFSVEKDGIYASRLGKNYKLSTKRFWEWIGNDADLSEWHDSSITWMTPQGWKSLSPKLHREREFDERTHYLSS